MGRGKIYRLGERIMEPKEITLKEYNAIVYDYNENGGDITYLLSEFDNKLIKMSEKKLNQFTESLKLHLEAFNERENDMALKNHFHTDRYDLSMTERIVGKIHEFKILELLNNRGNNVYTIVIERKS